MGLSIISKPNGSAAPAAPSAQPNTVADGVAGQFATLLSVQTLTAKTSAPAAEESTKNSGNTESDTALDPGVLMAMIGNPHIQHETDIHQQQAEDISKDSQAKDISLPGLPSGNEKSPLDINSSSARLKASGEQDIFTATQAVDSKTHTNPLPEKAANIAAELSENAGPATSFAANISGALLQHRITNEHQTQVSTPLHGEAWSQQFCEKIVWLAKNDQQSAQINITPPQLGPVQITLNLNGDQATALFSSPHAEVRQAIENSLPHLREMLASAGISLGDANVGTNLAQQNQHNPFMMANENQSTRENAILPASGNAPATSIGQVLQNGHGLVDLFA